MTDEAVRKINEFMAEIAGKSLKSESEARAFARTRPGVTRVLFASAAGERVVELGPDGNPVIDVVRVRGAVDEFDDSAALLYASGDVVEHGFAEGFNLLDGLAVERASGFHDDTRST